MRLNGFSASSKSDLIDSDMLSISTPNTECIILAFNKLNQLDNDWVLFRHENDPIDSIQIFNWFDFDDIQK